MNFKPGDLCKIVTSWYFRRDNNNKERFYPVKHGVGVIISVDKNKVKTLITNGQISNLHKDCISEKIG